MIQAKYREGASQFMKGLSYIFLKKLDVFLLFAIIYSNKLTGNKMFPNELLSFNDYVGLICNEQQSFACK